ncbi:hypothetical protein FA13DRAFT_1688607 [Coprinellus micaceus]|uniref:BTB domain-containing protein n=1 Tax=Coprinellus micaceus TaxID=71717 RepID=A0A4Y7T8P1_COPMI|nr:hypothetical protein FA13DRAFT_1688607 [Coprinellus micaceus]
MPKRRRVESDNGSEGAEELQVATSSTVTPAITRSSIWLSDGNIVLQAENTQFKVHQGYLARLSIIFSDVFSVPQPGSQPLVEGCVVLLLQDSAQDLSVALSEIYDRCYSPREQIHVETVLAMIRIGRKYEIQHLLKEGIARLRTEFPATLEDHDRVDDTVSWSGIIDNDDAGSDVLFRIANFCTSHSDMKELLPVLPLAYYWANCRNLTTILDGDPIGEDVQCTPTLLSPEAQKICLRGRQKLLDRFSSSFAWVDKIPRVSLSSGASHSHKCSSVVEPLTNILWKPEPQLYVMLEPWDRLQKQLDRVTLRKEMCGECYVAARKSHMQAREQLWNDLPGFFGLPSWDVLRVDA